MDDKTIDKYSLFIYFFMLNRATHWYLMTIVYLTEAKSTQSIIELVTLKMKKTDIHTKGRTDIVVGWDKGKTFNERIKA